MRESPLTGIIQRYFDKNLPIKKNSKEVYRKKLAQLAKILTKAALSRGCVLSSTKEYYCYIYLDPRYPASEKDEYRYINPSGKALTLSHRPLYVGKGKHARIESHVRDLSNKDKSRKARTLRKIQKLGLEPIRYTTAGRVDEATAFAFEIDTIRGIGRHDLGFGWLCNLTHGGDGASGRINSEESNLKRAESNRGQKRSLETRRRISEVQQGRKQSFEHRKAISLAHLGRIRGPQSPEHIAKLSAVRKGRVLTKEHRKKISANSGRKISVDGVIFDSVRAASKSLSIGYNLMFKRLKSNEYPSYIYMTSGQGKKI